MRCCSLKTLGVVIGGLTILGCLFIMIFDITALSSLNSEKSNEYAYRIENYILNTYGIIDAHDIKVLRALLIIVLIVCLKLIVISGLLIFGILKVN